MCIKNRNFHYVFLNSIKVSLIFQSKKNAFFNKYSIVLK